MCSHEDAGLSSAREAGEQFLHTHLEEVLDEAFSRSSSSSWRPECYLEEVVAELLTDRQGTDTLRDEIVAQILESSSYQERISAFEIRRTKGGDC